MGEEAQHFWSDRAVDLNLEANADREIADMGILEATLEASHLWSRDGGFTSTSTTPRCLQRNGACYLYLGGIGRGGVFKRCTYSVPVA